MDHAWHLLLPISPCWDNVRWQTAKSLNAGGISHPEISVGQMCCRIGGIDGLFAIDFNDTAVLYVPHILQLVEDVPCFVFDQDGRVRGLQHSRCQLLREHVHDKCVQGLQTVELVSDMNTSGLIAKLQEKDTWGERWRKVRRKSGKTTMMKMRVKHTLLNVRFNVCIWMAYQTYIYLDYSFIIN